MDNINVSRKRSCKLIIAMLLTNIDSGMKHPHFELQWLLLSNTNRGYLARNQGDSYYDKSDVFYAQSQ